MRIQLNGARSKVSQPSLIGCGSILDTPEGARRTAVEDGDPAFAVPLKAYLIDVLTRAQGVGLGPYWEKADEGTKHSLMRFLS